MTIDSEEPRYWEGRWRDEYAENQRLVATLQLLRVTLHENTKAMEKATARIRELEDKLRRAHYKQIREY
jgi:predicted transposase YdaD